MFGLFNKTDSKRVEDLEKRVKELEDGLGISIRLMQAQSEALMSLTSEVVRLSEALKIILSERNPASRKPKSGDYFH
jgi:hypothetical protein